MLSWKVFVDDTKSNTIKEYNIFTYGLYLDLLKCIALKYADREEFESAVKFETEFCFLSKPELSVMISGVPPLRSSFSQKVDVYKQLRMNWDRYIDYIWNNRKELTKNGN